MMPLQCMSTPLAEFSIAASSLCAESEACGLGSPRRFKAKVLGFYVQISCAKTHLGLPPPAADKTTPWHPGAAAALVCDPPGILIRTRK
jgi:hypothetical protein